MHRRDGHARQDQHGLCERAVLRQGHLHARQLHGQESRHEPAAELLSVAAAHLAVHGPELLRAISGVEVVHTPQLLSPHARRHHGHHCPPPQELHLQAPRLQQGHHTRQRVPRPLLLAQQLPRRLRVGGGHGRRRNVGASRLPRQATPHRQPRSDPLSRSAECATLALPRAAHVQVLVRQAALRVQQCVHILREHAAAADAGRHDVLRLRRAPLRPVRQGLQRHDQQRQDEVPGLQVLSARRLLRCARARRLPRQRQPAAVSVHSARQCVQRER